MDRDLYNSAVLLDQKNTFGAINRGILLRKLQMYSFETKPRLYCTGSAWSRYQTRRVWLLNLR